MPTPTPQQEAFYSTASLKTSVGLKARAGTGKTFSEQEWANRAKGTGLATSFSKSTVEELAKKMPSKFPAKGLHALGRQAIVSSGKYTKLDTSKVYNIAKDVVAAADADWSHTPQIMKLVSLAKTFGITPGNDKSLLVDTPDSWENLADQFDLTYTPELYTLSRKVLELSNEAALKEGIIDFDDMLYISLLWPHRFPRYPTIIADEVQDFNTLQHMMLQRLLLPGGRVIAAGDDRQAIYAFRGAHHNSYSELVSRFSMTEMPLTVSFRCPRAVVREAQLYVPDIEAAPTAIEGDVIHHDELSIHELPHTILCRNNAPLIGLALKLLVSGHTAEVAGQDIGKGLVTLTKRITKRNLSSDEFVTKLRKWAEREIERKPRSRARVEDKVSALSALAAIHRDLKSIQDHLLKLYPDPKARDYRPAEFHLSTIHRAKGREWPQVLFLDPHLLPSRYAEQDWELIQESNLSYVGITRAQEVLHYINSDYIYE